MARSRLVRPEFWNDEKLSKISREARLFFIGMWTCSDDHGVTKGKAVWLRSQIFPYDEDIEISTISKWLAELEGINAIIPYEINGEKYYSIRTFLKHQKIDHPNSRVNPEPPEEILAKISKPSRINREPIANDSHSKLEQTETETETETEKEKKENRSVSPFSSSEIDSKNEKQTEIEQDNNNNGFGNKNLVTQGDSLPTSQRRHGLLDPIENILDWFRPEFPEIDQLPPEEYAQFYGIIRKVHQTLTSEKIKLAWENVRASSWHTENAPQIQSPFYLFDFEEGGKRATARILKYANSGNLKKSEDIADEQKRWDALTEKCEKEKAEKNAKRRI